MMASRSVYSMPSFSSRSPDEISFRLSESSTNFSLMAENPSSFRNFACSSVLAFISLTLLTQLSLLAFRNVSLLYCLT